MRVLMVHNRYRVRGGEDELADLEATLLRNAGVEVDEVTADNSELDDRTALANGLRTVWSPRGYRMVRSRLAAGSYDVVHVRNFFPLLSPSVHWAAHRMGMPVVQELQNYRLACLNGYFFRQGQVCEQCSGRLPWRGVVHGCYRDSRMGSGAVAGMLAAHRALGTWRRAVDLFVTPSEYARRKLANAVPSERIVVKPHFIADVGAGSGEGSYALIAGRLSPEKGIVTLLRAWASGDERLPELRIVGDGPLTQLVTRAAAENPKVRYLGRKSLAEVVGLMGRASLVLYPSEWAETFGRSVIEAMSVGTPVVCSQGGAHSELVEDGVTGLSFPAGEARALAAAVVRLVTNRDRYAAMRRNARLAYLARYTPEKVLNTLLEAYDRARERRDHRMSRH